MATRDTYYAPGNQLELNKLGEGHSFGVGGGLPGTWRGDGIRGDQPGAVAAQRERGEGDGDRIERQSDRDANGGQGNKSTAQQGQKHLRVNWKEHEWRRWLAEFIGTFWLVFTHAGMSIISKTDKNPDFTRRLTFGSQAAGTGLSLVLLIYSFGGLSGAHFNPGITLSFTLARDFLFVRVPGYWIAQGGGAMVAAGALWGFFGEDAQLGSNYPDGLFEHSYAKCFFLEFLLSYLLQTVALYTAQRAMSVGPNAALAVGATLGLNTYVGGPFGGGSMNPWRSFAPGILSSHYRGYLWIYCIAPFCSTWLVALTLIMFRGWKVGEETITMATGEGMANV